MTTFSCHGKAIFAMLVLNATVSTACGGTSEPFPQSAPVLEARRGHAMTYSEAGHLTMLFGGWGTEGGSAAADRASTWTWNGTTWTRVATTGPSPRHDASMVYDANRQRVVLYGGRAGSFPNEVFQADTWEWNGTAWAKVADTGPGARAHQHMAYDRARSRVVLFGGFDVSTQQELHDIWEWNGTAWTRQNASGPANAIAASVVYDEKAASLLLFSLDNATSRIVTDVWNGTTLTRSTIPAPVCAPMGDPTVSLGTSRGILWLGYCAETSAETHLTLNGGVWTTASGTLPSGRGSTGVAYDRDRDRVVLFGGEPIPARTPLLADTWEFDGTAWTRK